MDSYQRPPPQYREKDNMQTNTAYKASSHKWYKIPRKAIATSHVRPVSADEPLPIENHQISTCRSSVVSKCSVEAQSDQASIDIPDSDQSNETLSHTEDDDDSGQESVESAEDDQSDAGSVEVPQGDKHDEASRVLSEGESDDELDNLLDDYYTSDADPEPPLPSDLHTETKYPPNITDSPQCANPEIKQLSTLDTSPVSYDSAPHSSVAMSMEMLSNNPPATPAPTPSPSFMGEALQTAADKVDGFFSNPIESTKHFSIFRHGPFIKPYQGSSTSITISIFSDKPLTAKRTLWLQQKGFSGTRGMKMKAFLGKNEDWLDVTPTIEVSADQLKDETANERDINNFAKKAPKNVRDKHVVRQTAVIRIPADAGDGYWVVVLCKGSKKNVLCRSSHFRIMSASLDPSCIRGASFSTIGFEIGAKMASTYAKGAAVAVAAPAAAAFAAQTAVLKHLPSSIKHKAVKKAYKATEGIVASTVEQANGRYDELQAESTQTLGMTEFELDAGPKAPYPIRFLGRAHVEEIDKVDETKQFDMASVIFTITGVAEDILGRLCGHYYGWVRKSKASKDEPWSQAIISVLLVDISQATKVSHTMINKKEVTIRLFEKFAEMPLHKISHDIRLLGLIRADDPATRRLMDKAIEANDEQAQNVALLQQVHDVTTAQGILDHPAWSADGAGGKSTGLKKISDGLANTRLAAQRQADRVPVHRLGVRTDSDLVKDRLLATKGFYVVR